MMLQFMWFAMGCIVTVLTFIGTMTLISIARFYEQGGFGDEGFIHKQVIHKFED